MDAWLKEISQNNELKDFYKSIDIAILDLTGFVCSELRDTDKIQTLKQFIIHC